MCIGKGCGKWISTGAYNTYIGYMAGQGNTHSTGYQNVFIGPSVGKDITTGYDNTCIGANSAYRLKTGAWNTCIGDYAGQYIDSGNYNVCVGQNAGMYIYYGSNNICIGTQTANAYSSAVMNMSNCIIIGQYAGPKTTDTSNTCRLYIGTPSAQNGNTYRGEDGSFIYGDYNNTTLTSRYLRINGHLGINCEPTSTYGLKVDSGNVLLRNGSALCWGDNNSSIEGNHSAQGSNNGNLYFRTNQAYRMCIIENGYVGIGTTSPGEKLCVNGSIMIKGSSNTTTTNDSKLIFTRDLADTDESEMIARIYTGNYTGPLILESSRGGGYVKTISNWSGGNPQFVVASVNSGSEQTLFRVNGNGRVGIGTTSPGAALDIASGTSNQGGFTETAQYGKGASTWGYN